MPPYFMVSLIRLTPVATGEKATNKQGQGKIRNLLENQATHCVFKITLDSEIVGGKSLPSLGVHDR